MGNTVHRMLSTLLCLLGCLYLASCSKSDSSVQPTSQPASEPTTSKVVFRNAAGRELTEGNLAGATGKFDWSVVGDNNVSQRAMELHRMGRDEGGKGNYSHALELFKQASQEAPN